MRSLVVSMHPSECHQLTAFRDACWGGQFGNAVKDGKPWNSSNSVHFRVLSFVAVVVPLRGKQSASKKAHSS